MGISVAATAPAAASVTGRPARKPRGRRIGLVGVWLLAAPLGLSASPLAVSGALVPVDSLPDPCTACHSRSHGVLPPPDAEARAWAAVCRACHGAAHEAAQAMVAGKGGADVGEMPSGMFLARVPCTACHGATRAGAVGVAGAAAADAVAYETDCLACHGERFGGMLSRWTGEGARRISEVRRYVAAAERLRSTGRTADSLLDVACANLALVEEGRPAHNVEFAGAVLRAAARQVGAAFRAAGVAPPGSPRLGPDRTGERCVACHFGVEGAAGRVFGLAFPHGPHLLDAGLRCDRCHGTAGYFTPGGGRDARHGQLTLRGAEDCRSCHGSALPR